MYLKKEKDEYNLMNNNPDSRQRKQMLIDYSNKKNIENATRPPELKIVYGNDDK